MTPAETDTFARHFKALSHPRRVRIFRLLAERPETGNSFSALQQATRLCDSSLSHHLREMERSGLVRRRRRGTFVAFTLETGPFIRAMGEALRLGGALHHANRQAA